MDINEKVVFGISPEGQGDNVPVILLGVPQGAWEYMKDGKTHTFDLTKAGYPVKIVMYGGKDHMTCLKSIEEYIAGKGQSYLDERRTDFSIKPKE